MVKFDPILEKKEITLADVHELYKKWITMEKTYRIDIGLALRMIAETTGTRVWMIFIGASGDWKSEQLMALSDDDGEKTKILINFTSKTLVNGHPNKNKYPDLAPKLQNKTIIIFDFAQLLKLHPNEKAEVWAQLRDLYDGLAGKQSGTGKDVIYKDLNVTLIGASTPAIDTQILIYQDLGTRELLWRCEENRDNDIADKIWVNEDSEDLMRYELKTVTNLFLNQKSYDSKMEVPDNVQHFLEGQALKLSYLRATAQIDNYSGELIGVVHPEKPTRVLKQLKRIYIALKCLDSDYKDSRAFEIIQHVVNSSSVPLRWKVLKLLEEQELSTNKVAEDLRIGYKSAYRELNILWNLQLISRISSESSRGDKIIRFYSWCLNKDNKFVRSLFRKKVVCRECGLEIEKLKGGVCELCEVVDAKPVEEEVVFG